VIGREDLIGDPRFDTQAARLEHEREVDEMIAAWTRQHEKREAMRLLGTAGVPAGAIFDTMELTEEADFERRGIMPTMQHPTIGAFKMRLAGALRRTHAAGQAGASARTNTPRTFCANALVDSILNPPRDDVLRTLTSR
jgi:crotonobetainyl-CoA:carnitine CoA-transferase CaiB-like acyl-CoA transferase